jgi:Tetracyclin repressor-like, C-terminal domain
VHFAINDAALLELMFAGKQHEQAGVLHEAADRAFSVILELVEEGQADGVLEPGEPDRIALLLFATMQGIAALVTAGIVLPSRSTASSPTRPCASSTAHRHPP